ncbi:MAG: JAB domain-containing protein [Elusimicrobiota bacterium]|nr:JAB domain-containing protein [Elusimicrobiota bacterium]
MAVYSVELVRDCSVSVPSRSADSPAIVAEIVKKFLGRVDREHFLVLMLDARKQVTGISVVSIGTLSASLVHPRELFKPAILANAAAVVVAHNHPSGDPTPSIEDREVTRRLVRAGELLGIPVLDHLIVAETFYSFREARLI